VGLTLSPSQVRACRTGGLDVHLADWKETDPNSLGAFDGVTSIGAFEHFCSEEEFRAGQQEGIYRSFFAFVQRCLPRGGRLYLQTMTWGERVPDPDRITLSSPRGSDEYVMAVIRKFYPGSWLPSGLAQIEEAASGRFRVVSANSGRLDYIATMREWGKRMLIPRIRTLTLMPSLIGRAVRERKFRYKLESLLGGYNRVCFERRLFDHQRIVLESVG
jgi:cyclopropane-fatty-acyl-phospholipid synthase